MDNKNAIDQNISADGFFWNISMFRPFVYWLAEMVLLSVSDDRLREAPFG